MLFSVYPNITSSAMKYMTLFIFEYIYISFGKCTKVVGMLEK